MLTIRNNHAQFDAQLARELGRDLPFAVARGITWTLGDLKKNSVKWTKRAFDRPTRWTQNALRVQPATKRRAGRVFYKDQRKSGGKGTNAGVYLRIQIKGNFRGHTRWEKLLIAKGVMRRNEYAMPGAGIRLNRFGNVPSRVYPEIIAQLRLGDSGIGNASERTMKQRRSRGIGRVFIPGARDGGASANASSLPRGIWQRKADGSVVPLFIFTTNRPAYEQRYPFKRWAGETTRRRLPMHVRRSADLILRRPNR